MTRKFRTLIGGSLVLAIFGGFFYSVANDSANSFQYYHTLDEFQAARQSGKLDPDAGLKLSGTVVAGSIQKDLQGMRIAFKMTDGKHSIPVLLNRLDVSDLFKDDAMVVVEGRMSQDGVFKADQLLAKCPTKYEAAEEKNKTASAK